jgi:hypothetical protein
MLTVGTKPFALEGNAELTIKFRKRRARFFSPDSLLPWLLAYSEAQSTFHQEIPESVTDPLKARTRVDEAVNVKTKRLEHRHWLAVGSRQ